MKLVYFCLAVAALASVARADEADLSATRERFAAQLRNLLHRLPPGLRDEVGDGELASFDDIHIGDIEALAAQVNRFASYRGVTESEVRAEIDRINRLRLDQRQAPLPALTEQTCETLTGQRVTRRRSEWATGLKRELRALLSRKRVARLPAAPALEAFATRMRELPSTLDHPAITVLVDFSNQLEVSRQLPGLIQEARGAIRISRREQAPKNELQPEQNALEELLRMRKQLTKNLPEAMAAARRTLAGSESVLIETAISEIPEFSSDFVYLQPRLEAYCRQQAGRSMPAPVSDRELTRLTETYQRLRPDRPSFWRLSKS